MNILFVSEYYLANLDFMKLSNELARRKHSIGVATSFRSFDKRSLAQEIRTFEIKPLVTIYSVPHSLSFPIVKIRRLMHMFDVQIVHALMDYSTNTAAASLAAKAAKVPFVYNVQGIGTRTNRFLVDALAEMYDWTIERFISQNARKLILLSKGLISRTRKLGVPDEKVVVVPSGVDCARFDSTHREVKEKTELLRSRLRIKPDDYVVGYVGRLVPAKGLMHLLKAAEKISKVHPNIVLLIVGEGADKAKLQAEAEASRVKAHFVGYQTDTPPYYSLMDVFVLPSFFEGLPGVVLEAMAMQKPVIATNVGGTADLVSNGENGFLVSPRNSEEIAFGLEKLVSQPDLASKMGKTGRQIVEKDFQWDRIVDRVEMIYKEVAE